MDTEKAKLLAEVLEAGSFSKYSDTHFLTRMNVKRQVDALETELGVQLLERDTRGVRPTPAGELFVTKMVPLLHKLDDVVTELQSFCQKPVVRFTVSSVVSHPQLSLILQGFSAACPHSTLVLYPTAGSDYVASVAEGRSDVCDVTLDAAIWQHGLVFRPVHQVRPCCAVMPNHPLATTQSIVPQDLVGFEVGFNHMRLESLTDHLRLMGIEPRNLPLDAENIAAIREFVHAGGCYICTRAYIQTFLDDAVVLDFKDFPGTTVHAGLAYRPTSPPHVMEFVEYLAQALATSSDPAPPNTAAEKPSLPGASPLA